MSSAADGLCDRVVLQVQADVRGDLVEEREVDGDCVVVGDGEVEGKGVGTDHASVDVHMQIED